MKLYIKNIVASPTPSKKHVADACYDVVATSMEYDETTGYVEYGLGFCTEFSDEYEVQIRPRSSISKYDLVLCNSIGTIDSTYRGEWKVRFKVVPRLSVINAAIKSKKPISIEDLNIYEVGDKVAQICAHKTSNIEFVNVQYLSDTERSTGGFGSTGV